MPIRDIQYYIDEALKKEKAVTEARERELILELENERKENDLLKESVIAIKSCADAFEFDAECRKDLLAMKKAEHAQMIVELREIVSHGRYLHFVETYQINNFINKYEVK
jgi:hypothetical protein